jgi:guanine deaminase
VTAAPQAGAACVLVAGVIHVPRDPFAEGAGALEAWDEGAIAIAADGRIDDLGDASEVRSRHPDRPVVDRRGAIALPGFVDNHVHYPQLGVIGAIGLPLLRWLDERTFPFEARFLDPAFAEREAGTFLRLLAANGTTSALVFGAHVPSAMEAFFEAAHSSGLRVASGLVVSDHGMPGALCTTPERAYAEAAALAARWHGRGRVRYAVSPRFAVTCGDGVLAACGALARERPELLVTSHLNESRAEIATVRAAFAADRDYLAVYERHGLVGPRSVFAHDVHASDDELARLAAAGAAVAHCPTSNAFLGSGAFPFARHRRAGVRVALGTDVGAGTSLAPLHEALQAYLTQAALGPEGEPLTAAHLLWLLTRAGADAIGLGDEVGDLCAGRAADLVLIEPPPGSALAAVLAHAEGPDAVLGACLALAREGCVAETWVQGAAVHRRSDVGIVA